MTPSRTVGQTPVHVLVVGAGSAGKRHAANLAALGCRVSCVDPRADRREALSDAVGGAGQHVRLEDAIANAGADAAVVATPTSLHADQTEALLVAGLPVLLEKPAAATIDAALRVEATARSSGVPLLLGYTWRWWPALRRVRDVLDTGTIGPLRHVAMTMSAHLSDWHPWERYQDFFMADAELGGGALLDESHWIDVALWLFGTPTSVYADVSHLSSLEISSDDNVDMLLSYDGGLRVAIHLDLYGRPHRKDIRFVGESGTLEWSETPNRLAVAHDATGTWVAEEFPEERNDMFVALAQEFLDVIAGRRPPSCGIEDGVRVLAVIEAARRCSETGRAQALST